MGVFDQAARYLIRKQPRGFLSRLLPALADHFEFRGWLDTALPAFPGEPDRICDLVALLARRGAATASHLLDLEVQTEPDPDMLERLGEYAYRLRREVRHGRGPEGKYVVLSAVIILTGPAQAAELALTEAALGGIGIHQRVAVWTVREDDAAATLARIESDEWERCLLPLIPLMQGGGEAGIIDQWKRIAEQEPDNQLRTDYGGLALVFASLVDRTAAWRQALEGWNMKQSDIVLEWQEEARQESLKQTVREALRLRFHTEVPADLAEAIAGLNSSAELWRWFRASLTAESLDAFRAAVQAPSVNGTGSANTA